MRTKYVQGLLMALFLSVNTNTIAQIDTLKARIVGKSFGDSILLRWAPLNYATWEAGKKYGYLVEKIVIKDLKQPSTLEKMNNGSPYLPISLNEWEELAQKDDQAGAAAEILYGKPSLPESIPEAIRPFKLQEQKDNIFGFGLLLAEQNFSLAVKMGLGLMDKNIRLDEKYLYKIFPAGGEAGKIDTASVYIEPNYQEPLPFVELSSVEFGDRIVSLAWNFKKHQKIYYGYRVERSTDGGLTYIPVTKTPVISMKKPGDESPFIYYLDSLPANKILYDYRIRGLTNFDEIGPSSNSFKGKGIPKPIEVNPGITNVSENAEKGVALEWNFPTELEEKIKGFNIYRSKSRAGKRKKLTTTIILPNIRNYIDHQPELANFYTVTLIDENDHEVTSVRRLFQLNDKTPPNPPIELEGKIEKDGRLTLKWALNDELDLKGYQVYIGNGPTSSFAQITNQVISKNEFTDSVNVNTLAQYLYFKIKAVDYRENYSVFSEFVKIPIPDLIPPVLPVWKKTKATDKGVELHWASSSSKDVVKETLLRRKLTTSHWDTIYKSDLNQLIQFFYDTTATYQFQYEYKVVAQDAANLLTENQIIKIKPIDNGVRKAIINFEIIEKETNQIFIEWEYPTNLEVNHFLIYRGKNDEPPSLFKKMKPAELLKTRLENENSLFSFEDKGETKAVYIYQIIAKHKDGGHSPLTPIKSIVLD